MRNCESSISVVNVCMKRYFKQFTCNVFLRAVHWEREWSHPYSGVVWELSYIQIITAMVFSGGFRLCWSCCLVVIPYVLQEIFFCFRDLSKMFMRIHSLLCLKTSKYFVLKIISVFFCLFWHEGEVDLIRKVVLEIQVLCWIPFPWTDSLNSCAIRSHKVN